MAISFGAIPQALAAVCCVALGLSTVSSAQQQFASLAKTHLVEGREHTRQVLAFDADGDRDLDLFFADDGQDRLHINDGNEVFRDATSRLPKDTATTTAAAFGDVDGDGDIDLVLGRGETAPLQTKLWLNDGRGNFRNAAMTQMPSALSVTRALCLVDVDRDNDLDIVLANAPDTLGSGGQNQLFLNDGRGNFGDVTPANVPRIDSASHDVAFGDVNGDGNVDLLFANEPSLRHTGRNTLWFGDGRGKFTDATASKMPTDAQSSRCVALGDFDSDGDLDLFVGNGGRTGGGGPNHLRRNDGTGKMQDASNLLPSRSDETVDATWVDIDRDLDLDLVLAAADSMSGSGNHILVNAGALGFRDETPTRFTHSGGDSASVTAADVDRDGDVDLVFANRRSENELHLNDGAGVFASASARKLPVGATDTFAVAAGDLDGDGDPDLVTASFFANRLLLNDGTGSYSDRSAQLSDQGRVSTGVAILDVDADGDLDVAFANLGTQNQLYLNDGRARFTEVTSTALPVDGHLTTSVLALDADGDGDQDLFFTNALSVMVSSQNRLYLNNGRGVFRDATATALPSDIDNAYAAAAGDVTGDGRLDIVTGNRNNRTRVYAGTASGTFVDISSQLPPHADMIRGVALGDVDRNGTLDIVLAGETRANRLFLNQGNGRFVDGTFSHLPPNSDLTRTVALSDIDRDGDLDLFSGNISASGGGAQNRLYLNPGNGRFLEATHRYPNQLDDTFACVFADTDRDGDPDLILGNALRNEILSNLHLQIDTPLVARGGAPFVVDTYVAPGYANTAHLAIGLLSLRRLTPPAKLAGRGYLFLDPAFLALLPPVTIPTPGGRGSLTVPIPSQPTLRGMRLHMQMMVLAPVSHADWRLTGYTVDRLNY